jgi:3-dehydroquinate synthase
MFGGEMTPAVLADIIESCVRFKAHIVEIDERERNERRLLNLGHTIGHAIEKCSGYTVGHGHAVAAGMAMMCRAGEKMGITELGTAYAVEETLERFGLPVNTDYTTDELADAALNDKKRTGDTITVVVPETIGQCTLRTEPIEALSNYIELGRVRR